VSDRWGRKPLITAGMLLQGVALGGVALAGSFEAWLGCAALLGAGTAMVYPTLLAAIGDRAEAAWRGSAIGVYRFWRDAGYVVGALGAGALADLAGASVAIGVVGALTAGSGVVAGLVMVETRIPAPSAPATPSRPTAEEFGPPAGSPATGAADKGGLQLEG
jgi:MFS family permease